MRSLFALVVLVVFSGVSFGQCPGGQCPVQSRPAVRYAPLGPTPVGSPPSPDHEWGVIPGYGYGWRFKAGVVPQVQPVASPCPNGQCPVQYRRK